MGNSFESQEAPLSEQEVISILDRCEMGAQEAVEAMGKYSDQCHLEADQEAQASPESGEVSNRVNIKADMKIAQVYLKSEKYKSYGLEMLQEALNAAEQDKSTADLAEQIQGIISSSE